MKNIRHLLKMTVKIYNERGFTSLIQRIFLYLNDLAKGLFFLIKYNKKKDILYISGCPGSSRFYRCLNQSEELANYGFKTEIINQNNPYVKYMLRNYDTFIFQRVIYNEHISNIMKEIKKQKKEIIFETDDLVFDPEYVPQMHYYNFMSEEEKGWYKNGIGREILEDSYVKNCIVSTKFLGKKLKEKYPEKNVYVSENKLNKKQTYWAEKALEKKEKIKVRNGEIRIGYFSGSKSHDADFEAVSGVILKILQENSNVIMMVVGHLDINGKFSTVKSQIERHSFVPLRKLPQLILMADINIIPLEIDNPFCQAKSGLKFFEAGLVEVPTIASATEPLRQIIENEKNGFLAKDRSDWEKYLRLLIGDKDLREKIGKQARIDSLKKYTTQKIHPETEFLLGLINGKLDKYS